MSGLAFVSYRRGDTSRVAQALYLQLKEMFGAGQLFMDTNSIRAGEAWPARVKSRLQDATVLLALMGPGWWIAADKFGRGRIDDRTDWVRKEILDALKKPTPIIPIVINHTQNLPDPDGLPRELKALPLRQAKILRLDPAERTGDVAALSNLLPEFGLFREGIPPQPPPCLSKSLTPSLTKDELAPTLASL